MPHRDPKGPLGQYEARSRKPNGELLITHHKTETKAAIRLLGNRRHTDHEICDHG